MATLTNILKSISQKEIIALDIGASSVKVAQLKPEQDKFRLVSFANLPLEEASIIEDEVQRPDHVIETIQEALNEAKINGVNTCIGISSPNSLTKRMNVVGANSEELEDNVLWESEQYIPFGVDDSEIDFFVLSDGPNDSKNVLMAAIRYDVVEGYNKLIVDAGLKTKYVDLNVIALFNAFDTVYKEELSRKSDPVALIDFGAQTLKVVVVKDHEPMLTKEVDIGGTIITEEIQRQVGVSYFEAEDLKINGDSSGNLPEEVVDIIESKLQLFSTEIRKVLNFYVSAGSSEPLDSIYITGGSANLPGLKEEIEKEFEVPVQYMDLQTKIIFDRKINDEQANNFLQIGANVLGLGLRK